MEALEDAFTRKPVSQIGGFHEIVKGRYSRNYELWSYEYNVLLLMVKLNQLENY